jgi:hypothetical protein
MSTPAAANGPPSEHSNRSRNRSRGKTTAYSNFGWILNAVLAAFVGYLFADRQGSSAILGISSPTLLRTILVVVGLLAAQSLGMLVALTARGRRARSDDPGDVARVGASIDLGQLPMVLAQLGVFGAFWAVSRREPDLLGSARNPWTYLVSSTLIGLVAIAILARRRGRAGEVSLLPRQKPRLPFGIRVTELTDSRLGLSHRSAVARLIAAVFCFGFALFGYLGGSIEGGPATEWIGATATRWVAIAFLSLLGCVVLLFASNRQVVFDKTADRIYIRDRFAWGKTVRRALALADVSGVVVYRETAGASLLINILVRIGKSTFPVIVGSRLPANAREHALVIGRFLDVPVYEEDRLLAVSPDMSVSEIIDVIDDLKHGGKQQPIPS